VEAEPLGAGLLIQAGPRPVTGADPGSLAPYRQVHRALRSLTAPLDGSSLLGLSPEASRLCRLRLLY
jgi:hypothetical protein